MTDNIQQRKSYNEVNHSYLSIKAGYNQEIAEDYNQQKSESYSIESIFYKSKKYKTYIFIILFTLFILQFFYYIDSKEKITNGQYLDNKSSLNSLDIKNVQNSIKNIQDSNKNVQPSIQQTKQIQRSKQNQQNKQIRQNLIQSQIQVKSNLENMSKQISYLKQQVQTVKSGIYKVGKKNNQFQQKFKKIKKQNSLLKQQIQSLKKKDNLFTQEISRINKKFEDLKSSTPSEKGYQIQIPVVGDIPQHAKDSNLYKKCPYKQISRKFRKHIFYTQYDNKNLTKKQIQNHHSIIKKCGFSELKQKDLQKYILKWNDNLKNKKIVIDQLTPQQRRLLLIFLRFYYKGGQYFYPLQKIQKVQQRCTQNSNIGQQVLFTQFVKQNDQNIYIPPQTFTYLKNDDPQSSMVKQIIENILNKKKMFQMCQQRQCLIINCLIK